MKKNQSDLYRRIAASLSGAACLLFILLATSTQAQDESSPAAIARAADPATVGVYSQLDGDKFYGTGVIISPDGSILTSTTVVPPHASEIEVYFNDHTKKTARIIEVQQDMEAVFLKVEGTDLPFLPLTKELPTIGEPAYTLGNSGNMIKLGDGASFSAGVVSGIYQVQSADNQSGYQGMVIETDAAINPGTDGGPLVNSRGQIIGIISRSFSPVRWQGTAIPITKIIARQSPQTKETIKTSFKPLFAPSTDNIPDIIKPYSQTIVGIEVKRRYPSEIIKRPEWSEYRRNLKGWESFTAKKQKRIMADFFAAESLLAANQMLRRPQGLSTGVIVSANGFILTCSFNVQSGDMVYLPKGKSEPELPDYSGNLRELYSRRSDYFQKTTNRVLEIKVHLPDGQSVPAEIAGFDTALNIALLKIDTEAERPYVDIEKEMSPAITGEDILLLGASSGNNRITINSGVVSSDLRNNSRMLQFDALLNYGNSGGILINKKGRLLGFAGVPLKPSPVIGKILPFRMPPDDPGARAISDFPNTPNSGIGLAVRADKAAQAIPQLREGAQIKHGMGIFTGFYPDKNSAFSKTVRIGTISKNSPAEKSGLKVNDKILSLDGVGAHSWKEIRDYLKEKKPGDTIILEIFRPLGAAYIDTGAEKFHTGQQFEAFLARAEDGEKLSGKVIRPGIRQKIFLILGAEK